MVRNAAESMGMLVISVMSMLGSFAFAECIDYRDYLHVTAHLPYEIPNATCWDVGVAGDFAVLAKFGESFVVVDVGDAMSLVIAGQVDVGLVHGLAVVGGLAFVTNFDGLEVISIADPYQPVVVGQVAFENGQGLAATGGYCYVCTADDGLLVVDVSVPSDPQVIGGVDTPGRAVRVSVAGNLACVADTDSMAVIDISDPTTPIVVGYGRVDEGPYGVVKDVVINGSYAYVAYGGKGLQIFDVSNPAALVNVGGVVAGPAFDALALEGTTVVLGGFGGDFAVADIASPAAPMITGTIDNGGAYGVAISNGRAFLSGLWGFSTVVLGDGTSAPVIGEIDITNVGYGRVATSGVIAAVANSYVDVYDIANPLSPQFLARADGITGASDACWASSWLYVATTGLKILDLAEPTNPVLVGSLFSPATFDAVAVFGEYAYVAVTDSLAVVDVSDPTSPIYISSVDIGSTIGKIAIAGDKAYLATTYHGVVAVDLANPRALSVLGEFPVDNACLSICTQGGLAFVAVEHKGILVLDVGNPISPAELVFLPLLEPTDLDISGSHLYVGGASMTAVDFINPTQPEIVGMAESASLIASIALTSTAVVGINAGRQLLVYSQQETPVPSTAPQVWLDPNPVEHGETSVAVHWDTVAGATRYAVLRDGVMLDGEHTRSPAVVPAVAGEYAVMAGNACGWGPAGVAMELVPTFLLAFEATVQATENVVRWEVASARPDRVFRVTGSAGGRTWDVAVAQVSARCFEAHDTAAPGGEVTYRLAMRDGTGPWLPLGERLVITVVPAVTRIVGVSPNPFNARTDVIYEIASRQHIEIQVVDLRGRVVRRLHSGVEEPGRHAVSWDGADDSGRSAASGTYVCRLIGDARIDVVKLSVVK